MTEQWSIAVSRWFGIPKGEKIKQLIYWSHWHAVQYLLKDGKDSPSSKVALGRIQLFLGPSLDIWMLDYGIYKGHSSEISLRNQITLCSGTKYQSQLSNHSVNKVIYCSPAALCTMPIQVPHQASEYYLIQVHTPSSES